MSKNKRRYLCNPKESVFLSQIAGRLYISFSPSRRLFSLNHARRRLVALLLFSFTPVFSILPLPILGRHNGPLRSFCFCCRRLCFICCCPGSYLPGNAPRLAEFRLSFTSGVCWSCSDFL